MALEDAIFLSRLCQKVYLIHRRDALRGAKSLQESVFKQENIEIIWDTVITGIQGENQVKALNLQNKKSGQESLLEVQGVFIAVGITPNSQMFEGLVDMEQGYIVAGKTAKLLQSEFLQPEMYGLNHCARLSQPSPTALTR